MMSVICAECHLCLLCSVSFGQVQWHWTTTLAFYFFAKIKVILDPTFFSKYSSQIREISFPENVFFFNPDSYFLTALYGCEAWQPCFVLMLPLK